MYYSEKVEGGECHLFGYIRICHAELSENDKTLYESFYCGLCRSLGKEFGAWNRSFLSYDSTFFALLHAMATGTVESDFLETRCPAPPFPKKKIISSENSVRYAANISTLLLYYKLKDGLVDRKGIKKFPLYAGLPIIGKARKKAASRYPEADEICNKTMEDQQLLEREESTFVDVAAQPSAEGLGKLLSLDAPTEIQTALYKVGYFVGRWVYLIDAVDDFEEDLASGSFNVWKNRFPDALTRKDIVEDAERSLNRTLGALAESYQELTQGEHWPVVSNIIYLGLPIVQRQVLAGTYNKRPTPSKKEPAVVVEGGSLQ